MGKESDTWGTPRELFDGLNKEFNFTLDACASECNTLCNRYIDEEINALLMTPWGSNTKHLVARDLFPDKESIFMNPPYSMASLFVGRAWNEVQMNDAIKQIVCLVNVKSDTKWWANYVMRCPEIRLIHGRLKFVPPPGLTGTGARQPSCVVIMQKGNYKPIFSMIDRQGRKINDWID